MKAERERIKRLRFGVAKVGTGPALHGYYVNFKNWVPFIEGGGYGPLDAHGVPLVDYEKHSGIEGGAKQYFSVTVAQYALGLFELWLETGSEEFRGKFLRMAGWLEQHAEKEGDKVAVWPARFDFPVYGLKAPWISSMAQAQGASVLLRAYQLEKRDAQVDLARAALASFLVPVGQPGGVRHVDADGDVWFEEYVTNPPPHVLNGFIFSLFGLLDYVRVSPERPFREAWEQGVRTLDRKLRLFDTGYWSRYDLVRDCVASEFYHANIHIPLLTAMYAATENDAFLERARRWEDYLRNPVSRLRARYHRAPARALRKLKTVGRKQARAVRGGAR
jgi:hypothetical protein